MSPESRSPGESRPCDFCNQQIAVLYCRADTAKLCLFCDQLVHSANALSKKHLRSQICDNCGSEPVSIRCATDNLVLCQDCDWDAHGSCAVCGAHDRNPVEGFSGCPSASELASAWGFDIEAKKPPQQPTFSEYPSWMSKDAPPSSILLQDFMVPSANNSGIFLPVTASARDVGRKQTPTCGKQKQVIFKQLIELLKRDLADGFGAGPKDLLSKTPNGSTDWQGNVNVTDESDAVMGGVTQKLEQQQSQNVLFSSLIMPHNPKDSDQMVEQNILWRGNSFDQNTQVSSRHFRGAVHS